MNSGRSAALALAAVIVALAASTSIPGLDASGATESHQLQAAPITVPGPPDAPEWWFSAWNVPTLWRAGADGRGITIGEIDSGVNASLPELAANILPGRDFGPAGGDGRIDREVDPFGHGTAMASIMVAAPGPFKIQGLAPAAKILPVAIPLTGTNDATANDHLAEAVTWAVDHGAKIINMSLGAARDPVTDPLACPVDEQSAFSDAISKGVILLAAAGNGGPSANPVEEPGVCVGVVTVGAVDSSGAVASFSSRHPYLTVSAPGVNVASLGRVAGQAYTGQGTSQATALTSAALALIWSRYPTLTGRQVLARLLATLDDRRSTADPAYGYGEINPATAINTAVPADAPNPVFAAADPYVAVIRARAALTPPRPVAAGRPSVGVFRAAPVPTQLTARVWLASAVAGTGLLALLLLTGFGAQAARRRRVRAQVPFPPAWAGPTDPAMPWHDVIAPPVWLTGPESPGPIVGWTEPSTADSPPPIDGTVGPVSVREPYPDGRND